MKPGICGGTLAVLLASFCLGSPDAASAQDKQRVHSTDETRVEAPEPSNIDAGRSSLITSDRSKVTGSDAALSIQRSANQPVMKDRSTLAASSASKISVTGGNVTISQSNEIGGPIEGNSFTTTDRSGIDNESSTASVTGGSFVASDSSEMKATEDSKVQVSGRKKPD